MIKEILIYPKDKEILTQVSTDVEKDEDVKEIIQDLKDTLKNTADGYGLSAIQIGIPKRICVIKYNNQFITLINPVITRSRGEVYFDEGCLSVPKMVVTAKRFQKVWCTYLNEEGQEEEIAEGGLCSIIIQHELDHFDGHCRVFY